MRDNMARVGVDPKNQMEGGDEQTQNKLDFVMPTEIVDLPSKGKFYGEGHPLYGKDTIEIRFMCAKDEDIITNKSLLKKGLAIDRLLQGLIVDKKIKIDDLLVGDKNALVVAARISGYGDQYTTRMVCSSCNFSFEHTFNLSEIKEKEVMEEMYENEYIMISLPKTKVMVECKLLSGKDEKYLIQSSEIKKKNKIIESPLTDQLKSFIISIDGQTDREYINKFVESMPASDSRYLRVEYFKRVPDINMKFDVVCPECDASEEVPMPLTADFFWPK